MAGSQSVNLAVDDVLRRLHTSFRSCLNFQSISPHLRSHELLTDNEWEVISNKDSRQDQVDEFLKVLPHKGRNCLNQLIECLQLSFDHAGHKDLLVELKKQVDQQSNDNSQLPRKDEVDKAVNTINSLYAAYMEQKEVIDTMKAKLKEQNQEIEQLKTKCTDQFKSIQGLQDSITCKNSENEVLSLKLQEHQQLLERLNSVTNGDALCESDAPMEDDCFETSSDEQSLQASVRSPSHSFSYTNNEHHYSPRRTISDIPHLSPNKNVSIEDKMKAYHESWAKFRAKCKLLEHEKVALTQTKRELEDEVVHLREALEAASLASQGSGLTSRSRSCSSLFTAGIEGDNGILHNQQRKARGGSAKILEYGSAWRPRFRDLAAIFNLKKVTIPTRRTSKAIRPPPESLEASMEYEKLVTIPENMPEDYLNPLCQGWLSKEGGNRKHWEKRWCVLSPRFFFYFEKKEDPADSKRPIGILPITTEMEAADCKTENLFTIRNTTRSLMKSCKLDKSRVNYMEGNHDVYNLQAPNDNEKNKWIEIFQLVIENLKKD
ncbi:putative leucine-rich repeat-containing protein DDB_G0290503 isoform X2 [Dysidea avara]|uniref:putative leucine-rich repeat-containing protein DDB_G0290503 isoform X2 n=1 Tax=Dysidea avara TaxID=196820 RepID=UPI0033175441